MTFPCNSNSNLHKAINMIREENNRMAIRRGRYYMFRNFWQIAKEARKVLDSSITNNIMSMRVKMSDEEAPMQMHLQWLYSYMHYDINNTLLYNYPFVMQAYEWLSYLRLLYDN